MESKTRCAHNVTRSCRINSTVTVADSVREPLKVLKILVEGLARDSRSSLWLTPLEHAPQLTRLFPFDLAYLDKDMKVLVAVALRPEVPAPRFHGEIASALILPFNSLQASGTVPGDQIVVCTEDELEIRLAEISRAAAAEPVTPVEDVPIAAISPSFPALPKLPMLPFPSPLPSSKVSAHTLATSVPRGAGFTVGMTASSWQISNSTTAVAVLEPGEVREAIQKEETTSEEIVAIAFAETESTEVLEETVASASIPEPEAVAIEREVVAVEPKAQEEALDPAEETVATEKLGPDLPLVVAETARAAEPAAEKVDAPEIQVEARPAKRKKPVGNVPAKVTPSTDVEPISDKTISQEEKKKESLGVLVKRFLNCEDPLPERRAIIRLLVQGLIAYTGSGETKRIYEVRDVSPTGVYLRTRERWQPGDVVSLVLQRKDATEAQREKHVTVDLKAVRRDKDGVGFEWLWPEGVELEAWKRVNTKRSDETDADYFLRELRLTRALGFLRHICPAAMEEMKLGLHKRLSNKRVASAVEIVLKAQELLGRLAPDAKVQAHPDMVRRILENGSWTEDDWIRQWWGGLLVSSCSANVPDSSNSVFIDLLAKLMAVHLRVLWFASPQVAERIAAGEPAAKVEVYCTAEELIEAVGSQSISRIQQTLGQLSSLGLLEESNKPSYVSVTDKVKTRATPTALGLTMYARCTGHR